MTASHLSPAASAADGAGKRVELNDGRQGSALATEAGGFRPGPLLLLGAPGVGKGTQAKVLMAEFGIPQISTGDLLRGNIRRGTDLGLKAKALMDSGQLVPDEVVNQMVAVRLDLGDAASGFILDGYPRTLGQSDWLDRFLARGKSGGLPLVAINLRVDETELLHRITGRRSCSVCQHIYNIYSNPPKADGVCDFDGAVLTQRTDDTEWAFGERMKAYEEQTAAVIEYYRHAGSFEDVDGTLSVSEVTAAIRGKLVELRARSGQKV